VAIILIFVLALGALLAPFFHPTVLIPAILVSIVAMSAFQLATGHSCIHTLAVCGYAAFALQSGFLAGLVVSAAFSERSIRRPGSSSENTHLEGLWPSSSPQLAVKFMTMVAQAARSSDDV
jgi:hypothetical protein